MKRLFPIFLSLLLVLSAVPGMQASAQESINKEMQSVIDQGIIQGHADGTYKPQGSVKRGEFATYLYRALQLPEGSHVFADVGRNSTLAKGINAAAKAKIVVGTSATRFSPDALITREQMAVMIERALDYMKASTKTKPLTFTDKQQIKATGAVMRMVGHDIIAGVPDGEGFAFKPKNAATRAHAAAFIYRMQQTLKAEGISVQPIPQPTASALSAFEQEVVELTNAERTKKGLQPLQIDTELSKVARLKSQDMKDNNYFNHNSPTYGSPFDMMEQFGISYRAAGENIAMGYRTPAAVVNGWMNSEGHRANILSSNFTHIGVGYVEGTHHWTQMFIGK